MQAKIGAVAIGLVCLLGGHEAVGQAKRAAPAPTAKPAAPARPPAKPAPAAGKPPTEPAKAAPRRAPVAAQTDSAVKLSVTAKLLAEKMESCEAIRRNMDLWLSADLVAAGVERGLKRSLADAIVTKGEYETTAEFEKRLRDRLELFLGNPDRLVFRIPVDGERQRYNADAEVLTVSVPVGRPTAIYTGDTDLVLFENEKKVASRVLGQTRMGIKFRYDSYVRFERFLSVGESVMRDTFGSTSSFMYSAPTVSLKATRPEALRLRTNLEIVLFGSLTAPWVESDDDEKVASLDDEYEQLTRSEVWHVKPRCAYLYDRGLKQLLHTYFEQ